MKNKSTFSVFIFLLLTLFSTQSKAQDDCAVCGWYVDGVKTDKIDCYSFDKLTLVLPYTAAMSDYDQINIWVTMTSKPKSGPYPINGVNRIPAGALKTYVKGNYIVFNLFSKNYGAEGRNKGQVAYLEFVNSLGSITRNQLYTEGKRMKETKGAPAIDAYLSAQIEGGSITSYTEKYNQARQTIEKIPNYTYTSLDIKSSELTCTKRILVGQNDFSPVDLTPPCSVPGTKVDFNNLGKTTSNTTSNSNTNSTSTNNTPAKTEMPAKTSSATGKTVITTIAPTSTTSVKPLDKTKPGYFEEKSDDKKYMYRNGYQKSEGVYHGEVREYEANQLEKIITYTNGVEDGLYVIFSDGKIEWSGNYKNGKKDGAWKHYKDGMLEETEKYINGEKQD